MKELWTKFSSVVTVVSLLGLVLYLLPVPFFDKSGTTLICQDKTAQVSVSRALSVVIGEPIVEMNTSHLDRFIFKDGTSVDLLKVEPEFLSYKVVALKSVVLPLWSWSTPTEKAEQIRRSIRADGYECKVVTHPDPAFPDGSIVLIFSEAFRSRGDFGYAVLIRKHAFRVGGQKPTRFKGFPKIPEHRMSG